VANVGGKGGKGWKGGGGKRFPRRTSFLTPNMFVFVVAFFYTCAALQKKQAKEKEKRNKVFRTTLSCTR